MNKWDEALKLNHDLLTKNPEDVDALNRTAYAYLQTGKIKEAKKYYKKVISIDTYNQIAKKNLLKISNYKKPAINADSETPPLRPEYFIEEPGKTKSILLINTAPFSTLSNLPIGKEVALSPKKHTIEIRDGNKMYIGALPDDISFRLNRCLKAGNEYAVFIKNVTKNAVSVFVRELKRGAKFKNQPSFIPQLTDYQASLHKEIIEEEEIEKKDPEENYS